MPLHDACLFGQITSIILLNTAHLVKICRGQAMQTSTMQLVWHMHACRYVISSLQYNLCSLLASG
jgi:hypothetical protein